MNWLCETRSNLELGISRPHKLADGIPERNAGTQVKTVTLKCCYAYYINFVLCVLANYILVGIIKTFMETQAHNLDDTYLMQRTNRDSGTWMQA